MMLRILTVVAALAMPGMGWADFGGLAPYLPKDGESDGAWSFKAATDLFEMANPADPSTIKYFYTDADAGPGARRRIVAEVQIGLAEDLAGQAGLLYGFDPETRHYFVFTVGGRNTVRFIRRDASGFNPMMEVQTDAAVDGINRLVIEETANGARLTINDRTIGEIGTDGIGQGGVGLVGVGRVRAQFSSFSIGSAEGGPPPLPN